MAAGILGVASAYQVACRGLGVVVLEKGLIGCAQSGRSLGFVRQQGRAPEELPLMIASNGYWKQLERELDTDLEWTQGGNLRLTDDAVQAAHYEEWARVGADFDLGTQVLSTDQVRNILPGVARSWLMAIFTPTDGHANPLKTTRAFADAAIRRGACVIEGCAVTSILTSGGRILGVETRRGTIRALAVVLAAGATSGRIAASLGLSLPQQVVRSTVVLTRPLPPITKCAVWAGAIAFRQTREGRFVLGPGGAADVDVRFENFQHLRWFMPTYLRNRRQLRLRFRPSVFFGSLHRAAASASEPEPEPNLGDTRHCLARLKEYFPQLGAAVQERSWAGNIEGTPDALPILDAPSNPRGLIVATGSSGHGFGMGPIIGILVADLVTRGTTDFDLSALRLSRFAEGDIAPPRHLL